MKKKSLQQFLLVALAISLLFSCKKSTDVAQRNPMTGTTVLPAAVEKQLSDSKQNLASLNIPATIISYQAAADLSDQNQLESIKKELVSPANYVPDFDGANLSSFSVATISDRMAANQKNSTVNQDVVKNIQDIVYPELKTGQKVLDILWQANGKQFRTKCIYDETGIVYDNMLSNIILTEMSAKIPDELKASVDANSGSSTNAKVARQYSFTSTVVNYTISWLWGSTRGRIVIKHYIIWNGSNYIYDHGGSSDAWMSVGSASGRWANNYLSRSSRSKMAWGYGWATPTASFSIKLDYKNLSFSTSVSGVGSKGSGSGIHTIYL